MRFDPKLHLAILCMSVILTACGGSGGGGEAKTNSNESGVSDSPTEQNDSPEADPVTDPDPATDLSPSNKASISGAVYVLPDHVLDSDLNDLATFPVDNGDFDIAQVLEGTPTVQGFVSKSLWDVDVGNFSEVADTWDTYEVDLIAGQVISLTTRGYNDEPSDADLYLYDKADTSSPMLVSNDVGAEIGSELITVPATGTYYVDIEAYQGASAYTLSFSSASTSVSNFGIAARDIIPGDVVLQLNSKRSAMRTSASPIGASLRHFDMSRSALAKIDEQTFVQQGQRMLQSSAMNKPNHRTGKVVETLRYMKDLKQRADVISAEPNFKVSAFATPVDPGFDEQWHYKNIDLPTAWDISTGDENETIVAVLDSGVWLSHEDLVGKFVDGYDFVSDINSSKDGNGIDDDPNDPGDAKTPGGTSSWHGTHVAGTVAANTNNNTGVSGVSWGAKIMPVRVLGAGGGGSTYDIEQGVRYAAGLANDSNTVPTKRADILNLSLGGPFYSQNEANLYQQVINSGVIVIAAAGNENTSLSSFPAAYPGVISVSATNISDARASYSNFGSHVDVVAPGGDRYGVLSTFVSEQFGLDSAYAGQAGTSMAAPHVAGVAALMKSIAPSMTPQDFESLLVSGALTDDIGEPGRDDYYGYGLINAHKAVLAAKELDAPSPPSNDPELNLSSTALSLDRQNSFALFDLSGANGVQGNLVITNNFNWVSLTEVQVDSLGHGTYRIDVDFDMLTIGFHEAELIFTDESGAEVALTIFVNVSQEYSNGALAPVYVVLFNPIAEESQFFAEVVSLGSGTSQFIFDEVDPGEYFIFAGSDIDEDFYICQIAETCGAYPLLSDPIVVSVNTESMSGFEFDASLMLAPKGAFSAEASSSQKVDRKISIKRH